MRCLADESSGRCVARPTTLWPAKRSPIFLLAIGVSSNVRHFYGMYGTSVGVGADPGVLAVIYTRSGDAVALSIGHRTCDLQGAGSSPGLAPWASYVCLCVTKQYNSVSTEGSDALRLGR